MVSFVSPFEHFRFWFKITTPWLKLTANWTKWMDSLAFIKTSDSLKSKSWPTMSDLLCWDVQHRLTWRPCVYCSECIHSIRCSFVNAPTWRWCNGAKLPAPSVTEGQLPSTFGKPERSNQLRMCVIVTTVTNIGLIRSLASNVGPLLTQRSQMNAIDRQM